MLGTNIGKTQKNVSPEPVLVKLSFVMPAGIVMSEKNRERERERI